MTVPIYVDPLGNAEQRIILPMSNDALLTFTVTDPNNNYAPVDLTGATITFTRKSTRFVPDTDPSAKQYTGTVLTPTTAGVCTVTIPNADNGVGGVTWYRLDVSNGSGKRTAQFGPLEVFSV